MFWCLYTHEHVVAVWKINSPPECVLLQMWGRRCWRRAADWDYIIWSNVPHNYPSSQI